MEKLLVKGRYHLPLSISEKNSIDFQKIMLERYLLQIYTKLKLKFYKTIFEQFEQGDRNLSIVETFSLEVIYALGNPTVKEFAEFLQISSPNATYKVNRLIKKGCIKRVQNINDKRKYYLEITDKYLEYIGIANDCVKAASEKMYDKLENVDYEKLEEILQVVYEEFAFKLPVKELN